MRAWVIIATLALAALPRPGIAQSSDTPSTPGIILAVLDGLTDYRRMVADCAPTRAPAEESASWQDMKNRVAAALRLGGRNEAFVAEAMGRLDAPGAAVECSTAEWHFSNIPESAVRDRGWAILIQQSFDLWGLPMPDSAPDPTRWDAISVAVTAEAETWRQPMTCIAVLSPRDLVFLSAQLLRNQDDLARALVEAGFPAPDIAALLATTGPDALLPPADADRAALMTDCLADFEAWSRVRTRAPQVGIPDTVAQLLAAP
jgi:hypothetical protein